MNYDKDKFSNILASVELGIPVAISVAAEGVSADTFKLWIEAESLRLKLDKSEATFIKASMKKILKDGSVDQVLSILRARYPEQFIIKPRSKAHEED